MLYITIYKAAEPTKWNPQPHSNDIALTQSNIKIFSPPKGVNGCLSICK